MPSIRHWRRSGFTLWETALVLAILGIVLVLTAPAYVDFGTLKAQSEAEPVLTLLREARRSAIETGTVVTLRLDPTSGRFRADTIGLVGMGTIADGTVDLGGAATMVTDADRLQFIFQPTGAAFADSVGVRGPSGTVMVLVDPWTGVPRADAR
jgi:prepilin-type N-terminal cleavage/methylation domain-containing protein